MFFKQSTIGKFDCFDRGRICGFNGKPYAAVSCGLTKGNIAMALEAGGQRFCKVEVHENGRHWHRRIHSITVQAADGQVHTLVGSKLPDSMSFVVGIPRRGAHMAEVLLSPEKAKGTPFLAESTGWISKRDAFYLVLGFFFFELITALADGIAVALM